jgi:hypothetical protein
MSGTAAMEEVCSAIAETARLVEAPWDRDRVRPILTAYREVLADGPVVFSVQSGERHAGELEYTLQVPPGIDDPYAHAVSNGFVEEADHPVGALFRDIQERVSVDIRAVDCGVAGGFKKLYALFPRDPQQVSKLAAIPSAPRALPENLDFFARHGLDDVAVIGIDYQRRTLNVYFQVSAAGGLEGAAVLAMLRDTGLPVPDRPLLEYAGKAHRIYATLGWDSPGIQRLSFAPRYSRGLDPSKLPIRPEPRIEHFLAGAPHNYEGGPVNMAVLKCAVDGEYFDFGSYFQISPAQLQTMAAAASQTQP